MSRAAIIGVVLLTLPSIANAQVTGVRVLRTSVVVEDPRGDAPVVATVSIGEVLEVLDQRGEWYLVRPVDSGDWRTGWINQTTVDEIQLQPDRTPSGQRTSYPDVETSIMWSLLSDREAADLSLPSWHPRGFNIAVAWNSNPWFGWELEGGAHFFSQEVFGTTLGTQEYTALTGPKFTFRQSDRVAPFLHLLTGPTFFFATDPLDSETDSDWDVGFQPGGGFDIVANERVAVRLGVDLRFFFRDASRECRFTAGLTIR